MNLHSLCIYIDLWQFVCRKVDIAKELKTFVTGLHRPMAKLGRLIGSSHSYPYSSTFSLHLLSFPILPCSLSGDPGASWKN